MQAVLNKPCLLTIFIIYIMDDSPYLFQFCTMIISREIKKKNIMMGVTRCDKCHSEYYNRKKISKSRTPPLLNFNLYMLDCF